MNGLLRYGLVSLCAATSAAATLGIVLFVAFKMDLGLVLQKINSDKSLYLLPVLILVEFYFFANDILAYLSKKHGVLLKFDFSEIRFTYDPPDVRNTAIPLRSKLLGLYPLSLALLSLGFAVVIFRR